MTDTQPAAGQQRRAFWLKHLHQWHWISSAICLIGMLLFAVTGFTLNHAGQIEARPAVQTRHATLPTRVLDKVRAEAPSGAAGSREQKAPVPAVLADWLAQALEIDAGGREAEWSADEIYVALPRPGGDAWVSIALDSGEAQYERTSRGAISYLNDLHKGRNTGAAWSLFLDAFALACLVFCVTGLFLLKLHAGGRVATWPLVGLGLVVPVLLAILFIH
ncbi:PepSY-associated TM helix domain-containing protein [Cupriavidus taiwanensis]|uniref:PepSY-associated TM helix domain-containing protein n=1 Tax=Cupriavidus taiwanensis TaxID=164546 RepID=UPI00253FD034|nr:PepSY-associated TM helix domain-containing protein [Cupriavidus taiwanensis]MDK3021940.1 PepSY-associated TM helix domain-containing protein [Cupriavidus taiwanensis]